MKSKLISMLSLLTLLLSFTVSSAFAQGSVVAKVSNFVEISNILDSQSSDLLSQSAASCGSFLKALSQLNSDSNPLANSPLQDTAQGQVSFCSTFPCAPGCGRTFCQCYPGAPWCKAQ